MNTGWKNTAYPLMRLEDTNTLALAFAPCFCLILINMYIGIGTVYVTRYRQK